MEERKPVGAAVAAGNVGEPVLIVVCDDGSVWNLNGKTWVELSPIPGSRRDNSAVIQ